VDIKLIVNFVRSSMSRIHQSNRIPDEKSKETRNKDREAKITEMIRNVQERNKEYLRKHEVCTVCRL